MNETDEKIKKAIEIAILANVNVELTPEQANTLLVRITKLERETEITRSQELLHKIHDTLSKVDVATKEDTISDILWWIDYYFEERKEH